jgi:hypothetical protein
VEPTTKRASAGNKITIDAAAVFAATAMAGCTSTTSSPPQLATQPADY